MLIKIGDFSKLSQLTVKMLRHYDDIGLLKPSHIDKFTNYRYYTIEQLSRIHRIIALKELGLSLEQIGIMLNTNPTNEQIQGMLALKESELEQRVREEQIRLAQVRFRLRMLELEESMPHMDVVIKTLEPVRVLCTRRVVHSREQIIALTQEVGNALKDAGVLVNIDYPQLSFVYSEDHDLGEIDLAVGAMIPANLTDEVSLTKTGSLQVVQLDGGEIAATYLHRGHLTEQVRVESVAMLRRWCIANAYHLADEFRMIFHKGPFSGHPVDEWLVEIQHLVTPVEEVSNV